MKIMIISNGKGGNGGWFRYSDTMADELEYNGHTICYASGLRSPLTYITNPFAVWLDSKKLKNQIQKQKPDIIHFTIEPYAMMLPRLGDAIAKKSVLTIHGSYGIRIFQGAINKKRACHMLRIIGRCITVSNYTKNRITQEIKIQAGQALSTIFSNKTTTILNGIVLPPKISIPSNNKKVILCIGEIKPRKGILESLNALHLYHKKYSKNFIFIIIGKYDAHSEYYQKIQTAIHNMDLEKHVSIKGEISEEKLRTYLKKADLYLMPAKTTPDTFEGFGLVYMEAASYGIPCIGTNDSGAAEAIKDGVSGYTCNPNDTEAIVYAMENILFQKKIKRESCRNWAKKHTIDTMITRIESLYQSLI